MLSDNQLDGDEAVRIAPTTDTLDWMRYPDSVRALVSEYGHVTFIVAISPQLIKMYILADTGPSRLQTDLDMHMPYPVREEALDLPPVASKSDVAKVTYKGKGTRTADYVLPLARPPETDPRPPIPTARAPTMKIVNELADRGMTGVYTVKMFEKDNVSNVRNKLPDKYEYNTPSIAGKAGRWLTSIQWEEDFYNTKSEYKNKIEMMNAMHNMVDIGINAELVVAGERASKTANDLRSVFNPLRSRYYRVVGDLDQSPGDIEIDDRITAAPATSLPWRIPIYKRVRRNTWRCIVASPPAAAQFVAFEGDELNDAARELLDGRRNTKHL